jgi:hypothetical protein
LFGPGSQAAPWPFPLGGLVQFVCLDSPTHKKPDFTG